MRRFFWLLSLALAISIAGCGAATDQTLGPEPQASTPSAEPQAADSDRDGSPDDRDECPNTPADAAVDSFGCPAPLYVSFVLPVRPEPELFDQESLARLREAARLLLANPSAIAAIRGHDIDTGSHSEDMERSRRWADMVRRMLVSAGVSPNRLSATGRGAAEPLPPGEGVPGPARNRRVQITIAGYQRNPAIPDPSQGRPIVIARPEPEAPAPAKRPEPAAPPAESKAVEPVAHTPPSSLLLHDPETRVGVGVMGQGHRVYEIKAKVLEYAKPIEPRQEKPASKPEPADPSRLARPAPQPAPASQTALTNQTTPAVAKPIPAPAPAPTP